MHGTTTKEALQFSFQIWSF